MSRNTPGNPKQYLGENKNLTYCVQRSRRPSSADYRQPETGKLYPISTVWQVGINPSTGTEGELWFLSKIVANSATWIQMNSSGGGSQTITGNTGGPISPISDNWDIVTQNSTVLFTGTSGTQTLDFGLNNLIIGGDGNSITSASESVGLGLDVLDLLTSGFGNTCIGYKAGAFVTAGDYNILLGSNSGQNYTSNESFNIIIGNDGVTGESNSVRIGTESIQDKAFLAGVTGVTVPASVPVAVDANGQLSVLGFGNNGQVLTSNGPGISPSWNTAMLINRSGVIDCTTNGLNLIFTSDTTFVPIGMSISYLNFAGSNTDSCQISVGWTSPNYTDLANTFSLSGVVLLPPAVMPRTAFIAAGISAAFTGRLIPPVTSVYANITNVSGTATTFEIRVNIIGYEI